ncbi:MAG: hypothetical protein HY868_07060 [Chloroflexi bacterium]|nr:hypothetical protein [Chloroflexota bacterium]
MKGNWVWQIARWVAVLGFLAVLQATHLPASAQGPVVLAGTRISVTDVRAFNFDEVARREAASPRVPRAPFVAPRMRVPELTSASAAPRLGVQLPAMQPRDVSPAMDKNFLGLDDSNLTIPPDTMGAVGVDQVVTMLNDRVRIHDKDGNILSTLWLDTFWGITNMFDPRIQFDALSYRWIAAAVRNAGTTASQVCLAASATSDPLGSWYRACFTADGSGVLWADFPQLGYNKDWLVITVNMFPIGAGSQRGQVYVFDKASVYAGLFNGWVWSLASIPLGMTPAVTLDPTFATENLIQHYSSASGLIRKHWVNGPTNAPVLNLNTTTFVSSVLGAWNPPGGEVLPQAGGTRLIDIIDARMQNAIVRTVDGATSLWCVQNIELVNGSDRRYVAQWWQLDADPTNLVVYQQGRVQDPTASQTNGGYHYAYPSLAVNKSGDVLIGASRFSSGAFASAVYAFRYASDPANTTRDPVVLKAGDGYYFKTFGVGENRWGDFSHTVVDPLGDVNFWTVQEYAATPVGTGDGSGRWGTWWGFIRLSTTTPSVNYFPDIGVNQ